MNNKYLIRIIIGEISKVQLNCEKIIMKEIKKFNSFLNKNENNAKVIQFISIFLCKLLIW